MLLPPVLKLIIALTVNIDFIYITETFKEKFMSSKNKFRGSIYLQHLFYKFFFFATGNVYELPDFLKCEKTNAI